MENLEIEIKIKLSNKYGVDLNFGWYPIINSINPMPEKIEVFQQDYIEIIDKAIKEIIRKVYNPQVLYTLIELEGMETTNIDSCNFYYDGLERMTTDIEGNFCIYSSHESSLTIGSREILTELKREWRDYDKYKWTTPFYLLHN